MAIDHELLLRKYIAHVVANEGTDYLRGYSNDTFVFVEWQELQRLSDLGEPPMFGPDLMVLARTPTPASVTEADDDGA